MRAYIIRRLLLAIPTLFILTIIVFLSVRFIPGDVIDVVTRRLMFLGITVDREAIEVMAGIRRACLRAVWTLDGRYFPAWHPWRITDGSLDGRGADNR